MNVAKMKSIEYVNVTNRTYQLYGSGQGINFRMLLSVDQIPVKSGYTFTKLALEISDSLFVG